jgi:hypothetical protein
MTPPDDPTARVVRWWVRRYTAGLTAPLPAFRRAEIESDLTEHDRCRRESGWAESRIRRERLARAVAGIPADIGWRHDQVRPRSRVGRLIGSTLMVAQLVLAAAFIAFAVYLLGPRDIADVEIFGRSPLRGFEGYADVAGFSAPALIVAGLGAVLAVAALARPVSPIVANAVTLPPALFAVMFFWLGIWAIGTIVVGGGVTDLVLRGDRTSTHAPRARGSRP